MTEIREQLEREARDAAAALPLLTDDLVERALADAAELLNSRGDGVLAANREEVSAGEGRLDAGALDRLRLDEQRLRAIAEQLRSLSQLPPLERVISSWTLDNGLYVEER